MDQLLLGYASSEDEDSAGKAGPNEAVAKAISHCNENSKPENGKHPDEGDSAAREDRRPGKRPKVEHSSSSTATKRGERQPSAEPATNSAAAKSRTSLPNPLALLEARCDEDRQTLLAPEVSVGPAVLQAPGPPRVRTFPHVVGNFPTVVLLPVPGMNEALDAVYRRVRRLLPDLEPMAQEAAPEALYGSGGSQGGRQPPLRQHAAKAPGVSSAEAVNGAGPQGPPRGVPVQPHRGYHVSLSRTAPIRHPQIAPLTALLSARLSAVGSGFRVSLAGLRSFLNDEGSRSFVSVMVTHGSEQICGLIRQVDSAFKQYGLPAFHKVPLPHVSVGWLPGDQIERIEAALRRVPPQGQGRAPPETGAAAAAGAGAAAAAASQAKAATAAAGALSASEGEVVGSWQATRAICVVGQREYVVWAP